MSKFLVLNDLHIGVQRVSGTTSVTADALRDYAHAKHRDLLAMAKDGDTVIINGDLTDQFNIDLGQAITLYTVAGEWLNSHPNSKLVWATGNHDLSKDSSKLGTVAFIGLLLEGHFAGRFKLVTKPEMLAGTQLYILPHVANQDLFDLELERVPDEAKVVLLHCNFDNAFAGQSDHSLNISREQAKKLTKVGKILVLGHEHQGRTLMGDKVIITGNQFPTSVSDCLSHGDAQADGHKHALVIESNLEDMELVPTWSPNEVIGWYQELDWRQIEKARQGRGFIRVCGTADAADGANVVKVISTLRQSSDAFVVTNAVKFAAVDGADDIETSIEEIRSVNVIELLLGMLDPDQRTAVQELMQKEQQ